jgi:hypothetical protein
MDEGSGPPPAPPVLPAPLAEPVGGETPEVREKRKRQPRNSACQPCAALKMKCVASPVPGKCERYVYLCAGASCGQWGCQWGGRKLVGKRNEAGSVTVARSQAIASNRLGTPRPFSHRHLRGGPTTFRT